MSSQKLEELHSYSINLKTREIYLHGSSTNPEIDLDIATRFTKNMMLLQETNGNITIHIVGSTGGDWNCGMNMFDIIQKCPHHVAVICHGSCMSMASIILQAADERISMPHCLFMVHEGNTVIDGTHKQLKSWMCACEQLRNSMVDIYADRCINGTFFKGKSRSQVKTYIRQTLNRKEDWFLRSDEALEYGFIDNILGQKYKTVKEIVQRN